MTTIFRQELDLTKCDNPNCSGGHPIVICGKCHPGVGLVAMYDRERGTLALSCTECQEQIIEVEVVAAAVQ